MLRPGSRHAVLDSKVVFPWQHELHLDLGTSLGESHIPHAVALAEPHRHDAAQLRVNLTLGVLFPPCRQCRIGASPRQVLIKQPVLRTAHVSDTTTSCCLHEAVRQESPVVGRHRQATR